MSTLEVNTINPQSGTTITIGVSGDTVTLGSGATQSGFGGVNTPSFFATASSQTTIGNSTWTQITLNSVSYDTDSAFSSNTFTVPTGKGGKYLFTWQIVFENMNDHDWTESTLYINGSINNYSYRSQQTSFPTNGFPGHSFGSVILTLSAGDTVKLYGSHDLGTNTTTTNSKTFLSGFKLIGA